MEAQKTKKRANGARYKERVDLLEQEKQSQAEIARNLDAIDATVSVWLKVKKIRKKMHRTTKNNVSVSKFDDHQ